MRGETFNTYLFYQLIMFYVKLILVLYIITILLSHVRCYLRYPVSFRIDYIKTDTGGKRCHERFKIYIGVNFK